MKTFRLIAFTALLFAFTVPCTSGKTHHVQVQKETYVYICTGPHAKVYHKTSNCSGLNKCSGDIVKVSLTKDQSMGRRACKKCY